MKLAFSTLACPDWPFEKIVEVASGYGYDGIEFRGILDRVDLAEVPEFSPAKIADSRSLLEKNDVKAACLSASTSVVRESATHIDRDKAVAHVKRYIEMAKEIGAPFVRVFGGDVPATMERGIAFDYAADMLRQMGDYAQPQGVIVVVETHDALVRSELLMELIMLTNHPAVQVLWDIHHPYRFAGESVAHTMRYLDGHVCYTHVKDSVLNPDGENYTYMPLGDGDVPVLEAMRALKAQGYDGYLTLEWEKRWHPELTPADFILPQYKNKMLELMKKVE